MAVRKRGGMFFIVFTSVLFLMIVLAAFGFLLTEDTATSQTFLVIALTAALFMSVVGIYGMVDAYKITKRYKAKYDQVET